MTAPEPQPAAAELIDLLAAVRPDWDRLHIDGALVGGAQLGIPWQQTHIELHRLAVSGGSLQQFRSAHRLDRRPGVAPSDEWQEAAAKIRAHRSQPDETESSEGNP